MPFFKNISLEVSGNDFNLNTKVNKQKSQISNVKFQIQNSKGRWTEYMSSNEVFSIHYSLRTVMGYGISCFQGWDGNTQCDLLHGKNSDLDFGHDFSPF